MYTQSNFSINRRGQFSTTKGHSQKFQGQSQQVIASNRKRELRDRRNSVRFSANVLGFANTSDVELDGEEEQGERRTGSERGILRFQLH